MVKEKCILIGINLPSERIVKAAIFSKKIRRSTAKRESWTIYLDTKDDEKTFVAEIW